MLGRRIDWTTETYHRFPYPELKAGDYGKDENNIFYCVPPGKDPFLYLGCLRQHNIIEHEDGTITVSPSILIESHEGSWHGFLERGVWRTC